MTPRIGPDRSEGRELPPRDAPHGEPAPRVPDDQRRLDSSGRAAPADVLGLQRLVGNRAVGRLLARDTPFSSPPPAATFPVGGEQPKAAEDTKDEPPPSWFPHGQPPGVPVKGYEHPRSHYSDDDKTHLTNALANRRRDNTDVVVQLMANYASSFLELWGRSVAHMMAKASVREKFSMFKVFVEFIIEESVATLLTGGAGLLLEEMAASALKHSAEWLAEKTAAYVAKVAVDYGVDKLEDTDADVAEAKEKADRLSKVLSETIPPLFKEIEKELEQPYEWYARYISEGDLTKFRIPDLLPAVPKTDVEAAVAGTIVAALHESQKHATPDPPDAGRYDPTEHQPVSYFDDNLVISRVVLGPGHTVAQVLDAEIYTPVPILVQALVDRSVREMPHIPMIVVVDTSSGRDSDAARELMDEFRSVGDPYQETDVSSRAAEIAAEASRTAEIAAFLDAYPDPSQELLLERYPRPQGSKRDDPAAEAAQWESMLVSATGGGLAEHVWLYRWAHGGDDLYALVSTILDDEGVDAPTPERLAQLTYNSLNGWGLAGAEQFFTQYAPKLQVSRPENRWDSDYWSGLRSLLYHYGSRYQRIEYPPDRAPFVVKVNTLPPR